MNVCSSTHVNAHRHQEVKYHQAVCVGSYTDLLKSKKIEIWFNEQKGFAAVVHTLNKLGNDLSIYKNLPLNDLPKEIASYRDISALKSFFDHAYLIPEKGMNGLYNRVSVRMKGPGGGRSTIPFQPGLALGSVVRGCSLEKMERYSEVMAKQQAYEEQISNAEKQLELLTAKINNKRDSTSKGDKALVEIWSKQIQNITKALDSLIIKLDKDPGDIPIFEGFYQALESPIDMGASKMEVQPRGFDSLEYSSQYIRLDADISKILDQITQSSNSNSASASLGGGFFLYNAKASASHSWSSGLAKRVTEIKNQRKSQGILLIHATVTTRNVRCFTDLKYNRAKLQMIQHVMKNEENQEVLDRYGITTEGDKKVIYMLTEAVLGGHLQHLLLL